MLARSLLAMLLLAPLASAAAPSLKFTVAAGKHDRVNEVVRVPFALPDGVKSDPAVTVADDKGKTIAVGQIAPPSLASGNVAGKNARVLTFVLPHLKAGETLQASMVLDESTPAGAGSLRWLPTRDHTTTLMHGKTPVLRYNHPKLDDSSAKAREATFKPFHELYSPDGSRLVTKGVGGQFTHHRGLFYGFMKVTYGKNTVDIWHCKKRHAPGRRRGSLEGRRAGPRPAPRRDRLERRQEADLRQGAARGRRLPAAGRHARSSSPRG